MTPVALCVGPRPTQSRRLLTPWMLAAALAVAGMGGASPAHAAQANSFLPVAGQAIVNGPSPAAAPSLAVGTWTSAPGESKDQFMLRVAVPLHAFTEATGFEACGVIAHERNGGSRMRVQVVTNQSQMGCLEIAFDDPDFEIPVMVHDRESIHTHPKGSNIRPNAQDVALFPGRGMRAGHERFNLESETFSKLDYEAGPGYVVVPGQFLGGSAKLLHQEGPDTKRNVGRLPKLDLAATVPDVDSRWVAMIAPSDPTQMAPAGGKVAEPAEGALTKPALVSAVGTQPAEKEDALPRNQGSSLSFRP